MAFVDDTQGLSVLDLPDRVRGLVIGAAVGDALGAGVEFQSRESIRSEHGEVREYLGGGAFGWAPGQTTDDTDLAVAVFDTYLENDGNFDLASFGRKLENWYRSDPPDIGNMTRDAIQLLTEGVPPEEAGAMAWDASGRNSAGNGSVMRCYPTALFEPLDANLVSDSIAISRVTHADPRAADSCVVVNTIISQLLAGATATDGVSVASGGEMDPRINEALAHLDDPATFDARGYCLGTMQIGLWALLNFDDFEEGLVATVGLGYDTDTNATVAGALLGAKLGYQSIPGRWRSGLLEHDSLLQRADRALAMQ